MTFYEPIFHRCPNTKNNLFRHFLTQKLHLRMLFQKTALKKKSLPCQVSCETCLGFSVSTACLRFETMEPPPLRWSIKLMAEDVKSLPGSSTTPSNCQLFSAIAVPDITLVSRKGTFTWMVVFWGFWEWNGWIWKIDVSFNFYRILKERLSSDSESPSSGHSIFNWNSRNWNSAWTWAT